MGCESLVKSKQTKVAHHTSRSSRGQGLTARSPSPSCAQRPATPRDRASGRTCPSSLPPPRPSPSDLPRRRGLGSAASARRPAAPPRRTPSGRGAAALGAAPPPAGSCRPASRSSRLQPAAHVQGGRREEEEGREERGEGGRERGRQAREGELLRARTSQSQPGTRTQRLSGSQPRPAAPHLLLLLLLSGYPSPPPSSSCYARAAAAPGPYSATAPTLWAHSWDARPRPILSSFLPSRPPALSRSPSRVPIVSVPFSVRRRLALPRLSLALPESPAAAVSPRRGSPSPSRAAAAPAPAPAARGARGREKWASAPSPSPAPQPCPAREDREDEQRQQSREGEHPERGQPSGGRGTEWLSAVAGRTWDGGRGLSAKCWRAAGGARVPGRRAAPGRERRGRGFGNRPGPETPPQTVAPGGCIIGECVFVGPRASACLKLRNFEDFAETFVSIILSFVCPGF